MLLQLFAVLDLLWQLPVDLLVAQLKRSLTDTRSMTEFSSTYEAFAQTVSTDARHIHTSGTMAAGA